MLFDIPELKSIFELDNDLENQYANLNALSEEIYRITNLLYDFYNNHKMVCFHYKANNDTKIYVDFHNVSDNTWFRTVAEIKEILYRSKINGLFQNQFSLNKCLENFEIREPNDEENYKKYLQLLYLFYIINYFAFPKKNIFKILRKEHRSYLTTYDEGLEQGVYLSFIISNLLTDSELTKFIQKSNEISTLMSEISIKISSFNYIGDYQKIIDNFEIKIKNSFYNVKTNNMNLLMNSVVETAIDYFQNYAMNSYSLDLLSNLTKEKDLFKFEKLEIKAPELWKRKYVLLDELDEFLYSDELIMFCKQSNKKLEIRDKIKFNSSNAVKFLKKLIDYDKEWLTDFDENNEGLIIEIQNESFIIYALKIAVIIKTYNDLVNKLQVKIYSKNNKHIQPLRTVLSANLNSNDIFPPTLSIRFFMLAAHAQYLNATKNNYYLEFVDCFLIPEILNMKVFNSAYEFNSYKETKQFLNIFLELL